MEPILKNPAKKRERPLKKENVSPNLTAQEHVPGKADRVPSPPTGLSTQEQIVERVEPVAKDLVTTLLLELPVHLRPHGGVWCL